MRLQIIYQNNFTKGFLTIEILISFSIFILFITSYFYLNSSMERLKIWSLKELDRMQTLSSDINNKNNLLNKKYGNETVIYFNDLFEKYESDFKKAWGRNSCNSRISFDKDKIEYFDSGLDIDLSNISTSLEVRNGIVYLTADSSYSKAPDFFIIDAKDPKNPIKISSLNTGPGLSDIEIAGPYAFVSQLSTLNQLQIIDISDRDSPTVISQLKLSLPNELSIAPFAHSIFYSQGFIYLGTQKWEGKEFIIIDVSDIFNPKILSMFETNTLINDIYINNGIAYLATSDEKQMRVLDVSDKSNPKLIDSFSPSGWQTQEGKVIDFFEDNLSLGRTVGGFNVVNNHEIFIFDSNFNYESKDIPGGVYGIINRPPNVFVLTNFDKKEFQVFDTLLKEKVFEMSLGNKPRKMACDNGDFYFATNNNRGISIIKNNLYE